MVSSKTGTREWSCSRSSGRISPGGVATSRQNMSGRGTITSRTRVSSSSKTLWIISRSVRSTTPSRAPTSTSVRSSSSEISGCPACRSEPTRRRVMAVKAPRPTRIGFSRTESHATGRFTQLAKRSGCSTARVMGSTSPNTVSRNTMAADGDGQALAAEELLGDGGGEGGGADVHHRDADEEGDEQLVGLREQRRERARRLALLLGQLLQPRPAQREVRGLGAGEQRGEEEQDRRGRSARGATRLSMEVLVAAAHRDRRAVGVHEDDLARASPRFAR